MIEPHFSYFTWQKQLKEGRISFVQSLRIQYITSRKGWHQEREAAGHIESAVRKQREMNAGTQLAFFFHSVPDPIP